VSCGKIFSVFLKGIKIILWENPLIYKFTEQINAYQSILEASKRRNASGFRFIVFFFITQNTAGWR